MKSKKLSLITAISVVIGCVIGSGVFVKPGRVLLAAGSANGALLAWTLGGLISLAGGLTLAEIASRSPKTGGIYVYMEEIFGKLWGFLAGWVQAIIYGPALMSALSLYFASLFLQFIEIENKAMVKPVALIVLFLLVTVTAISTHLGALIQNLSTFIKLIPIAVLGIAGLIMGSESWVGLSLTSSATPAAGMGVAILATLWAYDGSVQVANLAGEIENPVKNLPRAIIIGLITIMAAYLLVNISLFSVVPIDKIAELNEKTAAVAAQTLFGSFGAKALSLGILISIFGCLNGNILTLTRVPYAMATRGAFPMAQFFGSLNPKTQTPVNSIILKSFIAAIMVILLNPDKITDIAMFVMYLFYAAVFAGVILVRKKHGKPAAGSYSVPLYPVIPLLAATGSIYICFSMASAAPMDALVSLLITALGIPVYFMMKKNAY